MRAWRWGRLGASLQAACSSTAARPGSTEEDVVDLDVREVELTGLLGADERQPNPASFRDSVPHLFFNALQDDLFHAEALARSLGLQSPVKRVGDVDWRPHDHILPPACRYSG